MALSTSCGMSLLASRPANASQSQLWAAMGLWYIRPHVVNRKLFMAKELFCAKVCSRPDIVSVATCSSMKDYVGKTEVEIRRHLELCGVEVEEMCILDLSIEDNSSMYLAVRLLLPRKSDKSTPVVELSYINSRDAELGFAVVPSIDTQCQRFYVSFPYVLRSRGSVLEVIANGAAHASQSAEWLSAQMLPRLTKWAETAPAGKQLVLAASSLGLVSEQRYYEVYHHLKEKYGKMLIQKKSNGEFCKWCGNWKEYNWTEVTDPHRYVYEDIAIAAYLLVIWEQERQKRGVLEMKQSFVDLGCGNGLLVFLLSSEGYRGIGIDVRKRRIWDTYPLCTKLEVRAITPSVNCTFPSTDWIIGNHSDELTPWIPVIAARSSPKCRFFLLPCCFFDFDGSRYKREDSSSSRYSEYLQYVSRIARVCGYTPQMDRLRISSTKRKCIIGFQRDCCPSTVNKLDLSIQELIDERCGGVSKTTREANGMWADFTPRVAKEPVRNCTQIGRTLVQEIIMLVCKILLATNNSMSVSVSKNEDRLWNAGGCLSIKDMASFLPSEKLSALKNECGGLQTLLKNHRFIFEVDKGTVKLRVPLPKSKLKNINWATWNLKLCWFHHNHPDGCPLLTSDCPSQH